MRFPDTLQIKSEELEDTEWEALEAGIKKALEEINKFRIQEGKALIKDICHRIELIQELSAQVPQFEVKRVEVIRQKLQEKINEWTDIQNIDFPARSIFMFDRFQKVFTVIGQPAGAWC